ncbi:MAG: HD domain-containing phosphohydrolase [Pseudomonadota bacterium]
MSIRLTVVGLFIIVTVLTGAVAIGLQYHFGAGMARDAAREVHQQTADSARQFLASADAKAVTATRLLAAQRGLVTDGRAGPEARRLFAETLARNPDLYAVYLGFEDGRFYELINLESGSRVRRRMQALPQDRWAEIVVSGAGDQRRREVRYYDADFERRTTRSEPSAYRPDRRSWFTQAGVGEVHKTDPYLFQHLQAPGQTYSTRLDGLPAVLGVDVALSALSQRLAGQKQREDSQIFLFGEEGQLVASSEDAPPAVDLPPAEPLVLSRTEHDWLVQHPTLRVSNETDWPPYDFTVSGRPSGMAIDVLALISAMTGLDFRYVNGYPWPDLVSLYREGRIDVLQPVLATQANRESGRLTEPFASAPFGVLRRQGTSVIEHVDQLAGKRVAIPGGWSSIETFEEHFPSVTIEKVEDVSAMFRAVSTGRVDAGVDTAAPLRYTRREGFHADLRVDAPLDFGDLAVPQELHFLFHPSVEQGAGLVDRALAAITDEQWAALRSRWMLSEENGAARRTVPYAELVELAANGGSGGLRQVDLDGRAHYVYIEPLRTSAGSREYFAVATPATSVLAPALAELRVSLVITAIVLLLLLPVAWWIARFIVEPVHRLAEENEKIRQRRYGEVERVESRIVEIDDLGLSLTRMARAIREHVHEQEALMDAFVELVAQAIDDKSSYTGAHCRRVPELAMLLAEKAQQSERPPFDRFAFADEHEWREFRIAAWLHDCGKIATPEFVVDKESKLQTIHDRIHEIRTRFEVLRRDAEIDCLTACRDDPENEAAHRDALERRLKRLEDDFAFVAACNDGSQVMDKRAVARLETLARVSWKRHFDDRLGLSGPERTRRGEERGPLPADEPLLADKPWHVIEHDAPVEYDPRYGIRMDVPEHLYNRGELHNLKIPRGTLTSEERFKIQEHVIGTIRMLDRLPLPPELSRVPRYASTHHERMDGQGYPRGLTGEDLSWPERIMALADVFEALTAADRPYKQAKSVPVAIDILHDMVRNGHLDRDVFVLFLESGAYLEYARRYLPEEQIEPIDLSRYRD